MSKIQAAQDIERAFKDLGAASAIVLRTGIITRWADRNQAKAACRVMRKAGMMPSAIERSIADDGWIVRVSWNVN